MNKKNFTDSEFVAVCEAIAGKFPVRFNKCGNITIEGKNEHWTLYYVNGKCLWRRYSHETGYCYPLNMIGRKRIGKIHREIWTDYNGVEHRYYWSERSWDMNNTMFNSVNEALNYFKTYLVKYKYI